MTSRQCSSFNRLVKLNSGGMYGRRTDWDVGIGSDWELLDNTFRRYVRLLKVSKHLLGSRLLRTVARSDLHCVVFRFVCTNRLDIRSDLAVLQLHDNSNQDCSHKYICSRTCRTVTGSRAPLSSHITVIPRLRAMRPVRIEFGVHFAPEPSDDMHGEAVALFATVACNCLIRATVARGFKVQNLSMLAVVARESARLWALAAESVRLCSSVTKRQGLWPA